MTIVRFQAIKDCDGIEGDGDFEFQAFVTTPDGGVLDSTGRFRGIVLGPEEFLRVFRDFTFGLPEQPGSAFNVNFTSSEVDQPLFSAAFNDSRMDDLTSNNTHTFSNGRWTSPPVVSTGLGDDAVQLRNGSGECTAELHYRVDIS